MAVVQDAENTLIVTDSLAMGAITDSYKRLIKPSIENEFAALSKDDAD